MNNAYQNGLFALKNILSSYEELKNRVADPNMLGEAAKTLAQGAYSLNPALQTQQQEETDENIYTFATYLERFENSREILSALSGLSANYINGTEINIPLNLFLPSFAITIETENENDVASDLAQQIAIKAFGSKTEYDLRCVDLCSNGKFFDSLFSLSNKLPDRFGGRIFVSKESFDSILKESQNIVFRNVNSISDKYESVLEYNKENKNSLISYLYIFNLNTCSQNDFEQISKIMKTRKMYGMSFIIVGNESVVSQFKEYADFNLYVAGDDVYLEGQSSPLVPVTNEKNIGEEIEKSVQSANEAEKVDTLYENNPTLHMPYLEMESSSILRIPFAIEKDGSPLYFEIGGDAPTHALMSGSTGSGKSVALHSIIMQIAANYHPDDVEIWAIDYKAVEFDEYMVHRTPHFRVVAHDTSVEFSLSLLDLLYQEYESRMKKFLDAGVKNIKEYRKKNGKHSMPRIVVVIDEFQIMTQAVQTYTGDKNYTTILENLLKLTRAMGISFVFCSQTIASGLRGLTESARDQIGCRLCLKHDDGNEIRETLMLTSSNSSEVVQKAINLRRGQGIYKRVLLPNEPSVNGARFQFLDTYVIYINDKIKYDMIEAINAKIGDDYTPKKEIFVRGSDRILISEKSRHPLSEFLEDGSVFESEGLALFPAAPTSLDDYYCVSLDNASGANLLMIGENDALRDSVVFHSVCSCLSNPDNEVIINIVEETNNDRARLLNLLKKIKSPKLTFNVGIHQVLECIEDLRVIKPGRGKKKMYFWYGLDKMKNELFLLGQNVEEEKPPSSSAISDYGEMDIKTYLSTVNKIKSQRSGEKKEIKSFTPSSLEDYQNILLTAFDMGPENDLFHFVVFNNYKSMGRSDFVKLSYFENILATRISSDDAFRLFSSGTQIEKADENTIVYGNGGRTLIPLRPYLLPDDEWIEKFNKKIN